ncbi:MAG TPA: PDZ domain-containing protein [Pyrinomonadaceae bacterium]|nr:PDZ domain-containing protein [Pyrinomonadaceae bacterium]
MKNEAQRDDRAAGAANCPNCGTLMPSELRFCRACGHRMGEGPEEYNETMRFDGAGSTARGGRRRTGEARAAATLPANSKEFREAATRVHEQTVKTLTGGLGRSRVTRACKRVPRWMVWVLIPLFVIGLTSGLFSPSTTRIRNRNKNRDAAAAESARNNSYLGSHYRTDQGGAFLEDVTPPGSAADKAGLVGGDVITSFDGKPVKSESDLSSLLSQTQPGKTVEVVYVRDGETKTAKLTTISEHENARFEEAFDGRPQPKGFLGVDDDMERVEVPGTKIYGVRLSRVFKNRPAYIAGLRDGDVVIEFDGVPIRTPQELNRRIDRALPDSTVKVVVMRGSERLEIPVKMGEE